MKIFNSSRLAAVAFFACSAGLAPAQNPALLTDLVSYWPLDVIQGSKTPDLKSGYDLTVENFTAADVITGQKGKAFRFDRTRSMIATRLNDPGEDLPAARLPSHTISFWARIDSAGQNSLCIYADGSTTSTNPFGGVRTDNRVAGGAQTSTVMMAYRPDAGGNAIISRSAALPFDGLDWHHIVLVQELQGDGTATRKIFVDGEEDMNTFATKADNESYTVNATAIGGLRRTSNGSFVTGDIDEVAVWKRALSATEISDLKSQGMPPIGPPPEPLKVNSFTSDFPRVAAGRPVRLRWDATKDATLTITPAPGNVTAMSTFGVGQVDVTPTTDTIYTLTLTRGADAPVTQELPVGVDSGVAAGWDVLETFQFRNNAGLGGQFPWRTGNGFWRVTESPAGNKTTQTTPQESVVGLPLGSLTLPVGRKATLFTRFGVPVTDPVNDIFFVLSLSDKNVRFGADWLSNNGPSIRLYRTEGGPVTMQARNGQGSEYEDAAFVITPGTAYNLWLDIENVEGVGDIFSVHTGAVGSPRVTVFSARLSDRLETEVTFLGFPRPVLDTLVLATPVIGQSAPVLLDDFFLSTSNAYNATEPVTSSLTFPPAAAGFDIVRVEMNQITGTLTLEWTSTEGGTYAIEKASTPDQNLWQNAASDIPSTGASTSHNFTVPLAERGRYFYRVRRQ